MSQKPIYPNIDMQKTGRKLKHMIESAGYTLRVVQEYLHLSCVQPIYRWSKGKILPSVDHLLMHSELLDVHMEDLGKEACNTGDVRYRAMLCSSSAETIYSIL